MPFHSLQFVWNISVTKHLLKLQWIQDIYITWKLGISPPIKLVYLSIFVFCLLKFLKKNCRTTTIWNFLTSKKKIWLLFIRKTILYEIVTLCSQLIFFGSDFSYKFNSLFYKKPVQTFRCFPHDIVTGNCMNWVVSLSAERCDIMCIFLHKTNLFYLMTDLLFMILINY